MKIKVHKWSTFVRSKIIPFEVFQFLSGIFRAIKRNEKALFSIFLNLQRIDKHLFQENDDFLLRKIVLRARYAPTRARRRNIFLPNEFFKFTFLLRTYFSTYFSLCIIYVTIIEYWSDSRETGALRIEFTIGERKLSLNKLVDVMRRFKNILPPWEFANCTKQKNQLLDVETKRMKIYKIRYFKIKYFKNETYENIQNKIL